MTFPLDGMLVLELKSWPLKVGMRPFVWSFTILPKIDDSSGMFVHNDEMSVLLLEHLLFNLGHLFQNSSHYIHHGV